MNIAIPDDHPQSWHDERRNGVGSTDAAAILGLSPWSTPFDVWREKVGDNDDREPRAALQMYVGKRLQDTVGDLYVVKTGRRIRADNKQHVRRGAEWMTAHLDFRVLGDPGRLIEAKTAFDTKGWGEDGSTVVPVQYWCQVQHEMAVTGATMADIAVLFGHRDFRVYPIPRDDDFIGKLTTAEEEFWTLYVVPRVPPPVDHTEAATRYLNRRNPTASGTMIPATPEMAELVDRYRDAVTAANDAIKERDRLKNRLIQTIGPNDGLRGADFEVTYRNVKPGAPVVVWPQVGEWAVDMIRALAWSDTMADAIVDAAHASDAVPDDVTTVDGTIQHVIKAHTEPGRKGYRRFDFNDRKGLAE
jgi:putative phage-type endonuclease